MKPNLLSIVQDGIIFGLFSVGLVAMIAVVHYASWIDSFWSPDYFPTQVVSSVKPSSPETPTLTYSEVEIQSILNHPENLRNAEVAPTPAQAILEDRGTKFLMGL